MKQNSKYDLVRRVISLLIVLADLRLKMFLPLGCTFILMSPRRLHYWDSKTLVSLNVLSGKFTRSYLSGGLHKITIRTGLDLGRKIFIKMLSVLMQKLGFRSYEILFKKTSYTSSSSGSVRSYQVISFYYSSLLKTVLSSLISLNPITIAFVTSAM